MTRSPIFLPFKYKIPFPLDLTDRHGTSTEKFGLSMPRRGSLQARTAAAYSSGSLSEPEWQEFCDEYLEFLRDEGGDVVRDGWKIFLAAAESPAQAFNDLLLSAGDTAQMPNINPRFSALVSDALRDGVLSAAEEGFLKEKRATYGVSSKQFTELLSLKRRFNRTLLLLIDEVCSDGVITTAEETYLREKAQEFGAIPWQNVKKQIARSLQLHQYLQNPGSAPDDFVSLVGALFLSRYVLREPALNMLIFDEIDNFLSSGGGVPIANAIELEIRDSLLARIAHLAGCRFPLAVESVSDLLLVILEEPDTTQKTTEAHIKASASHARSDAKGLLLDGLRFQHRFVSGGGLPLVSHEICGNLVSVTINRSDPLLNDTQSLDFLRDFALSLTLTRIQLFASSDALDLFFDQLHVNNRLVPARTSETRGRERASWSE